MRLGRAICLFGSGVAWPLAAFAQSITQPTTANLPKIEVVRVKPIDLTTSKPRFQLSNGQIDLMKVFSLGGAEGIGATWKLPLAGETFDARYGRW